MIVPSLECVRASMCTCASVCVSVCVRVERSLCKCDFSMGHGEWLHGRVLTHAEVRCFDNVALLYHLF